MPVGKFLQTYGVLVAFVILVIANAFWVPDVFLQPEYIRNLVNQNAAVGILAIGLTLVILGGGIDLSVGSLMALTASLGLLAMNKIMSGQPMPTTDRPETFLPALAAVGVSVLVGTVLGALNGFVITLGKVAPFIATLVGLVVFRSVATALAAGGEIRSLSNDMFPELGRGGLTMPFVQLSEGRPLIITWPMLVFVLSALFAGFLLNWTRYGRHLIAVGANEKAAIYSAIHTNRVKVITYTLMGFFAGVAAIGLAGRLNSVSTSQMGLYYELDAIAAVVIGGTSMSGGRGRIWSTVVGVLMLGLITNMLVTSGVSVYWQGAVKGVIILLAVLIQRGQSD
jgi:ribose transport system permease protein